MVLDLTKSQFVFSTDSSPNAFLVFAACFSINAEDAKEEIVLNTKVVFELKERDTLKILLNRVLNMIIVLFRILCI